MTRVLQVVVLALACSTAASAYQDDWDDERPANEVARELLGKGPGTQTTLLHERLAKLGLAALPDLFDVLEQDRIPVRVGEHGNSARDLESHHRTAVMEAFLLLPRRRVLGFLDVLTGKPLEPNGQRAALHILGRLGSREELSLLGRVGTPAEGAIARRAVREAFQQALQQMMERDSSCVYEIPSLYARSHPSYLGPIAAALGHKASSERLLALTRLLGLNSEADRLVLIEIGRMAARGVAAEEFALANVRPYLRADDVQLMTEATMAVAHLEDRGAVPRLIELISHENRSLAQAALGALRGMTGKVIGRQPESWAEWYRKEMEWWRQEASGDLSTVASGPPELASRTILQLSKKRMFKNELAEPLAASLERSEPDLVVLGCAALGHLGSENAVPYLVRCLEREDENMRGAAWRALRRITGLDLGADPQLWKQHIEG